MDVTTIIAGIIPAVVSTLIVIGAAIANLKNIKDVVGNTKKKDEKIIASLSAQNQKIDEYIVALKVENSSIQEQNNILAEEIKEQRKEIAALVNEVKILKEQNDNLEAIKNQQTVIMDRMREE